MDLSGKTVVVTGANTGIGRVTAEELAKAGARVILACRSAEKTQPVVDEIKRATNNDQVEFLKLDLASLSAVRSAAAELLERVDRIDILINNAGLAGQRGETQDGFEMAFGVNHLGHFLWTLLLLDRVKESAPARIVNVASQAHYGAKGIDFDAVQRPTKTVSGFPEYEVSKLANVLFTKELARRLEGSGVTTYSLHPGVVASDVWRRVPAPFRWIMKKFMISNEDGAKTTLHCATSPATADHSGRYYDECKEKSCSPIADDERLQAELWSKSEQWVGLSEVAEVTQQPAASA